VVGNVVAQTLKWERDGGGSGGGGGGGGRGGGHGNVTDSNGSVNEKGPTTHAQFPLEVVRSRPTGCGLYAKGVIPKGSFVCHYAGELKLSQQELKTGNEYAFDVSMDWEYGALGDTAYSTLLVDAKFKGNVGRFINHSCKPNTIVVPVYSDDWAIEIDPDKVDISDFNGETRHRVPLIAVFAAEEVSVGDELTLDYNYNDGRLPGQVVFCSCGKPGCHGEIIA
jgi:hypothetical protein